MSTIKKAKKDQKNPEVVDSTELAIKSITDMMKRKDLSLADIFRAVDVLSATAAEQAILRLYADGNSIRKVARMVHMDDKRVSKIIKANGCACEKKMKKAKAK